MHLKKFATNFSSNWRYILCSWKTTFEIYQQQHSLQNQWFSTIYYYILKKKQEEEEKKYFLKRKRFPIFCKIQQRFVMSNNVKWSENACLFYIIFLCNKYSDGSHTRNPGCFGFWKTWGLRNIFKVNWKKPFLSSLFALFFTKFYPKIQIRVPDPSLVISDM